MIDAHAHVAISFTPDEQVKVINSFKKLGGTNIIDVSTSSKDNTKVSDFISRFDCVFATVGIHPEHPKTLDIDFEIEALRNMIQKESKVIGIGEIGLDYPALLKENNIEFQLELLTKQIAIAKEFSLPLIIHARGKDNDDDSAYIQVLDTITQEKFTGKVYFHSFGGSTEIAKRLIDNGYVLGINGISTYSGAKRLTEALRALPLDSFLLETDTPYLIPSNMDRELLLDKRRNEPIAILYTAKRIAKIKDIELDTVLETTEKTTKSFFDKML